MSAFVQHTDADREAMLRAIGVKSFDDLTEAVPKSLRLDGPLAIDEGISETEVLDRLGDLAAINAAATGLICFAGGGIYDVCVPSATKAVASRPEFATAYTPYQAEVSQGTLQAVYEFQTLVTRLTGMDLANASMYDGGTALAEAVILALGVRPRKRVLVSPHLNPNMRGVLETLLSPLDVTVDTLPATGARTDVSGLVPDALDDVAAVVLQHPNYLGALEDVKLAGASLDGDDRPLFIASVDLSSLSLLDPPGVWGADIAVGEAQVLGIPMNFGGPACGVFAARQKYLRRMPGRIVGLGKDAKGQRAFTLAFQTREQHIRRDKATSNICTNQALTALMATVTTALLGETGRGLAATLSAEKAAALRERLAELPGTEIADADAHWYREFLVRLPAECSPHEVLREMAAHGFLAGIPYEGPLGPGILVAVTGERLWKEIDAYVEAFRRVVVRRERESIGTGAA